MATAASIKIVKNSVYKGGAREWSNRYHFDGGAPADNTKWTTLADAVTAAEKLCFTGSPSGAQIILAVGYDAGSEVPVFQKTYTLWGTGGDGGNPHAPGDAALLVRYATNSRTSKNHPLYLFNYYHNVITNGVTSQDYPYTTQKTAFQTYAAAWITGFSDGSVTHHRCGPNGDLATGALVGTYVTHRDFPNA